MSKKPEVSFTAGHIIYDHQVQYLEGQLLTVIESLGLRETQEKAAKDIFRKHLWEFYTRGEYISGEWIGKVVMDNQKRYSIPSTILNTKLDTK